MQPDFREVAESIGLQLRTVLVDDHIHRCATELHPKKRNGAYRTDGCRGWVKNWETGETIKWHAAREVSRVAPLKPLPSLAERRAEEAARAEWAAGVARHKIAKAHAETHPYLASKGFPKALGLVHEGLLLVPARIGDAVVSLQEIDADGGKKNLPGGRMSGAAFSIGQGRDEVLCEGYATALSIRTALAAIHLPVRVTCCFSASNIASVAERRPRAVILADHDNPVAQFGGLGTGEFYARRTGLPWAMPPEVGTDANDYHLIDGLPALQRLLLDLLRGRRNATASVVNSGQSARDGFSTQYAGARDAVTARPSEATEGSSR